MPKTHSKLPVIAIVGRPNVGKSSLFNRIIGKRKAIVEEASGTTRDRLYAEVEFSKKHFTIIDTGGFHPPKEDLIENLIIKQLETAIKEADILIFVVDGMAGITSQDSELAQKLRKTSKKIFLAVNKVDNEKIKNESLDFFELAIGEPYFISATHNIGVQELLYNIIKELPDATMQTRGEEIKVAIVGRPNVGKSSYLNTLLNEERVIVHPVAGTTRDSIDTYLDYNNKKYLLIDTAGIRHSRKLKAATDFYAMLRTKEAIKRADLAFLIIDGYDGLREDDTKIMDIIFKEKKALIVAINKWDLVKNFEMSKYEKMLINRINILQNYPIIFMSCKQKRNMDMTIGLINSVYENFSREIPTHIINETLNQLNHSFELKRKNLKFGYALQSATKPPRFIFFTDKIKNLSKNLSNYIENFLRKVYDFKGTSIIIDFKEKQK